jgi:hypothetical protein
MTDQYNPTGAASRSEFGADASTGRVQDTAKSEASSVASTAAGGARDVAGEASTQAKAVAGEAKEQLDRLVSQGRDEVRQQAAQRTEQAAGQLRTLSEQFTALMEGRPEAAGPLVGYASDLQGQLRRLASRMEQGGPEAVIQDVAGFARRRPGVFLAGAAGIGFVVGRLVRAGVASQREDGSTNGDAQPHPNGPVQREPSPLPPPVHTSGSVL